MKYAFKLDSLQKAVAEYHLANYKAEKKELKAVESKLKPLPETKEELFYEGSEKAKEASENAEKALKMLSSPYANRMLMGTAAVGKALQYADETDMKILSLLYWKKKPLPVEEAALEASITKADALCRINKLLAFTAYFLGYVKEDFTEPEAEGENTLAAEIRKIISS